MLFERHEVFDRAGRPERYKRVERAETHSVG